MINLLKELCKKEKNIALYMEDDSLKFAYGRILAINQDDFIFYSISQEGLFDGIFCKSLSSVIKIEIDGQYEEKMNKIISKKLPQINYLFGDSCLKKSFLHFAKEKQVVLSMELRNSGYRDIIGFIETVSNNLCKVKVIDEYGCEDGFAFFNIIDVSQIMISHQENQNILKLRSLL